MYHLIVFVEYFMIILGTAAAFFVALRFIHMLQLESYQGANYLLWLKRSASKDYLPLALVFIICTLLEAALPFLFSSMTQWLSIYSYAALQISLRVIYLVLMCYVGITWRKQAAKKPLVFTDRVKRLATAIVLLLVFIYVISATIKMDDTLIWLYTMHRSLAYLPALILPFLVLVAHYITYPIEEHIKKGFYNQAKNMLENRTDLIKIGITGSFGKTSTKYILGTILQQKYNTLITPHSFNTPMGITRVVREQLRDEHEVFVAEMGARYVGDIDELCDLVAPSIGLLTAVGEQHLQTFGSMENIANTKYELIAALPKEGAAFFNGDNDICAQLSQRNVAVSNRYLYGIKSPGDLFMRAMDYASTPDGSIFTLLCDSGAIECRTKLLGKHSILNITGCAAVAKYMGLTLEEIARGIAKLECVEHRLQLIQGAITVIDDAFNSNPEGAKAALEVLRSFDGRKIIVTPGMVELGDKENDCNRELGREIACSVDYAILVGIKRSEPIVQGMLEKDFPRENIFIVPDLTAASAQLAKINVPGDIVLFENDLPDNYTE